VREGPGREVDHRKKKKKKKKKKRDEEIIIPGQGIEEGEGDRKSMVGGTSTFCPSSKEQ